MNKPFQYSTGAYMLLYKGSEIPVYCRVCPEPFLFPYHKKGMFAHLQGTTKLKAVSRLLGRTPRLQACLAQAESPVCRHISTFPIVAALTSFTSQPRDRTWVSRIGGSRFNLWATRGAQSNLQIQPNSYQITNDIFHGTRTRNNFAVCVETQKTSNS